MIQQKIRGMTCPDSSSFRMPGVLKSAKASAFHHYSLYKETELLRQQKETGFSEKTQKLRRTMCRFQFISGSRKEESPGVIFCGVLLSSDALRKWNQTKASTTTFRGLRACGGSFVSAKQEQRDIT